MASNTHGQTERPERRHPYDTFTVPQQAPHPQASTCSPLMVLLGGMTERLLHLGALLLRRREVAEALLAELERTLLLAHTQELLHALLKGRQTDEVGDDRLDGAQALVRDGVAVVRRRLARTAGRHVTLVEAGDDAGARSWCRHDCHLIVLFNAVENEKKVIREKAQKKKE